MPAGTPLVFGLCFERDVLYKKTFPFICRAAELFAQTSLSMSIACGGLNNMRHARRGPKQ